MSDCSVLLEAEGDSRRLNRISFKITYVASSVVELRGRTRNAAAEMGLPLRRLVTVPPAAAAAFILRVLYPDSLRRSSRLWLQFHAYVLEYMLLTW